MSKLNQDQELMDSILAKEWHTLYAEEIILVMNYTKEQQAIIDNLKAQLNNMEACYIQVKKERDEVQNRLKAVYALSRMRAAVIGSWKREELSIKVRKAISHLVKKEQALRGES